MALILPMVTLPSPPKEHYSNGGPDDRDFQLVTLTNERNVKLESITSLVQEVNIFVFSSSTIWA